MPRACPRDHTCAVRVRVCACARSCVCMHVYMCVSVSVCARALAFVRAYTWCVCVCVSHTQGKIIALDNSRLALLPWGTEFPLHRMGWVRERVLWLGALKVTDM